MSYRAKCARQRQLNTIVVVAVGKGRLAKPGEGGLFVPYWRWVKGLGKKKR